MSTDYQRIISLVPSLTELIIDLGLKEKVVGRTRFCIHPEKEVTDIPIIGGTKNPRLDKIRDRNPDYIIANREENRREHVEELARDFEIDVTDIATIEDALITIHTVGTKLGVSARAERLIQQIQQQLDRRPDEPERTVAYLIWKEPWMTVGNDTYIHDVLSHWNLVNVFGDKVRYPKITLDELQGRNPDLILMSSEPYPFKEKHTQITEKASPGSRTLLVDGAWFSWYGSHMKHAFSRLNIWRKAIA